ncbi:MAG: hypothetical protein JO257_13645 [Deltaproteobacteria bacterium]|nr:hypothetical protein [Deltaproteobacteria bacterium]
MHGPVVAASARDYPDRWEPNRAGVARVIARTLWHAHLDASVTLEDLRGPKWADRSRLQRTHLELAAASPGKLVFAVSKIGNDNVAGTVAHEVGRAFITQLPAAAFRSAPDSPLPDPEAGTIATVYLGLGVIALNAARYRRAHGEIIGRSAYHEHEIVETGGLAPQDLALLLAVQATVRDDVLTALDTLEKEPAELVAKWLDILDDHEDELREMLGVTGDDERPIERPAKPADVTIDASHDEGDLHRPNVGRPVFRYPETRSVTGGLLGVIAGFGIGLATMSPPMMGIGSAVGVVGGYVVGRRKRYFRCASCGNFVTPDHTTCSMCGGNLVGEIKDPRHRLDAEEEYEQRQVSGRGP